MNKLSFLYPVLFARSLLALAFTVSVFSTSVFCVGVVSAVSILSGSVVSLGSVAYAADDFGNDDDDILGDLMDSADAEAQREDAADGEGEAAQKRADEEAKAALKAKAKQAVAKAAAAKAAAAKAAQKAQKAQAAKANNTKEAIATKTEGADSTQSEAQRGAKGGDEKKRAKVKNKVLDPSSMDRLKSVQHKPVLRIFRAELSAFGGAAINDPFYHHLSYGGSLVIFPQDSFAIGLTLQKFITHFPSDNIKVIRLSETSVTATLDQPSMLAAIDLYWLPFYGKISLLNHAIIPFDLYLFSGIGRAYVGDEVRLAMSFGVGERYYLADWLAIRFELRDTIYNDVQYIYNQPRSDVQNFLTFNVGLSIFLPPHFEYSR